MPEIYTEHTKFGSVRISYDGVSPFETIGQIGEFKIGTRVCLNISNKCIGTVKWMGRQRGVSSGGFLIGVKLDDETLAPSYDRTFGEYHGHALVHTTRKDVTFRGIKSWEIIYEDKHPGHVGIEAEKKLVYKRHTPDSKFNQILVPVNDLEEGSRVKLSSGTTGTVRWIGCYYKKEVQPKEYIVGVELDSTSKEYTSLLTNGRLEGERLVSSSRNNIKFVKLKELIPITGPLKSRQHESSQNTDSKSGAFTQRHRGTDTMAGTSYAFSHQAKSGNMPESYTERTKFGSVRISYDGVSPFETVEGWIGEFKIGTRVCLNTSNKCIGTVKWMGRQRGVSSGGFLIGVKLDDEASAPSYDRTFGEYGGHLLVYTTKKDVVFRGIKSWEIIYEDKHPGHVGIEAEKKLFYKRHTPDSKFNQILVPVNGLEEGSRVKLSSGTTGTVRWIGCYHKKEVQPKEYIVGVELDSISKEYTSLLTNGLYGGEQLVPSSRYNIRFVKLKDLIPITGPLKSRQLESRLKTTAEPGGASHHSKPGSVVRVSQATADRHLPPTSGQEKNKKEFPMINNPAAPVSEQRVVTNGHSVNKSYKHADIVTSNEPLKSPGASQSSPRPSPPPLARRQVSTTTPDDGFSIPLINNRPNSLALSDMKHKLHRAVIDRADGKEIPASSLTYSCTGKSLVSSSPHDDDGSDDKRERAVADDSAEELTGQFVKDNFSPMGVYEKDEVSEGLDSSDSTLCIRPASKFCRILIPVNNLQDGSRVKLETGSTGTIRWMGCHSSGGVQPSNCIVGVELDSTSKEPTSLLTNGLYEGEQLVGCSRPNIKFVKLQELVLLSESQKSSEPELGQKMTPALDDWEKDQFDAGIVLRGEVQKQKDHTYFTNIIPLDKSEKELINSIGAPLDDIVGGYVLPPTHKEQYHDIWKGLQGDQNSGYMDASIFAMFSYLTVFDNILFDPEMLEKHSKSEDRERAENIRSTLLRKIVNPLRKYGLVQKQGMHELRKQLDEWGLVRGMTGDEKDPEEFLNLLLVHTFCTPPPICLSNGQESHLFHLLADKEEGMPFPTVQELVERTCLQEAFKFTKIPPYLILHLPRWGKDFKMYDNVMPSLELDITGVLCGTRQTCYVCGKEAHYECYGCYKDTNKISEACFCDTCRKEYHSNVQRSSHKLQRLPSVSGDGGETPKCVLKLAAVLCIETSHYVTFVASDTTPYAQWYFFDSMADRQGTTNIPEVTELKEFRSNLKLAKESITSVSPLMRRLVKDGYICFYSNPDIPQYHYATT